MTKKTPALFMGYVEAAWKARFPGTKPPPHAVKALRGVYEALGDEEATARLERYLRQTEGRFVNLWGFATTHPDYAVETPKAKRAGGALASLKDTLAPVETKPYTTPSPPSTAPDVEVEEDPQTGRLVPKRK